MALEKAQLVGTFMELILYGVYIMLFVNHSMILRKKAARTWAFVYLLGTSVSILCLTTIHVVLDIIRATAAFTDNTSTPFAAAHYYADFDAFLSVFRTSIYNALTIVSDAFIVYRCFLVWSKSYRVSFVPFLLFLADFGTAVWSTSALREVKPGDLFATITVTFRVRYFYAFTLALNLLCTLLISYKIWIISRAVVGRFSGGIVMSRIIAAVIESAAAYSALLVALIVTSVIGSDVMFGILNIVSPVIGIVFSAVIVRVSSDANNTTFQTSNLHMPSGRFGLSGRSYPHTDHGNGLEIRLEQITHTRTDDATDKYTNTV